MRLYSVLVCSEFYFKSLRKPLFKEVGSPLVRPADEDIAAFVSEIIPADTLADAKLWTPTAGLGDSDFADAEFTYASYADWSGIMDEILKSKWYETHPISIQAWQLWRASWNTWQGSDKTSVELWDETRRLWRLTWGNLHASDRAYWAAKKTWEEIRARPVWTQLYEVALKKYQRSGLPLDSAKWAKDSADLTMRLFMKGEMTFKEFDKARGMRSMIDYLTTLLGKFSAVGMAILLKVALVAVAVLGVLIVIINPSSKGVRRKHYDQTRLLMRYADKLWWADMVGRSASGVGIYKRCEEVKGFVVTRRVGHYYGKFPRELFTVVAEEIGQVKINWFYWVSWPWRFDVLFRGYLVRKSGDLYNLQERWRKGECRPMELYKDAWGNLKQRLESWFDDREGYPSVKPGRDQCREVEYPEWILFEGEIPM